VVIVVSPSANAAYYIAAMLASFLFMVPTNLSTVLYAIASAAPELMAEKLRFVLRTSVIIGVPGGLILGVSSHFVLSVFGSSYASMATGPLWLLIASYIPTLPNTVYIAVCRATGRVNQATILLTAAAAIQMVAVVIGGKLGGLYGLSFGMLAVALLQALVTTPRVLRAAYGSTRVRSAAAPATLGHPTVHTQSTDDRQAAGLAALLAIATTAAPDGDRPSGSASAVPADEEDARTAQTRAQASIGHSDGRQRGSAAPITKNSSGVDDRSGRPDVDDADFDARQQAGVAALIAIANDVEPH
jgi:hypothetical protein